MKKTALFSQLILLSLFTQAQNFAGQWKGELTQDGKPGSYSYEMEITQIGNNVEGTATSQNKEGGKTAKFEIGGQWNGTELILQEVQQLEPPGERWCLKLIHLGFSVKNGIGILEGPWTAQGCTPGFLSLQFTPPGSSVISRQSDILQSANSQFSILNSQFHGKWAGHLSQSDREYGFYFGMSFSEDGTGVSEIISDGEGGNAAHAFRWTFNETAGVLHFEETGILEKSVPTWRWCIKSGPLVFKKEENRLSLTGDWEGFIEGFTKETGPCASGKLYVEQPVFKKEELAVENPGTKDEAKPLGVEQYKKHEGRDVQVERVIEVKKRNIKIRVWDNGTVDGDILSLFLNGEHLLNKYRVTRRKHEIFVTLDKPVNYLILHAINLGSISPNTVAVSVDDGSGEQVVMVSSTLKTSGAVMIREFTVK